MLVSGKRLLRVVFIRCLDPIPAAVSVPSEAPGILESTLVVRSTTEDDHHASCATHVAHCRGMVDAYVGALTGCIELLPGERCFVDIQAPDIIDGLGASVAAED